MFVSAVTVLSLSWTTACNAYNHPLSALRMPTSTPSLYLADHYTFEHRVSPPPSYYGVSPSGYGSRIPTDHQVRVNGAGPWRRVYAICFSNAATHYVSIQGRRYYFRTFDLSP